MRKIQALLLFFFGVLILSPSLTVHANDNAYVSCLYDEQTMCYRTSVIYGADEAELQILEKNCWYPKGDGVAGMFGVYYDGKENYLNGEPSTLIGVSPENPLCQVYKLNTIYFYPWITHEGTKNIEAPSRADDGFWENKAATVCTFPTNYHHNATKADINRAYEVADILGGDLTKALVFLNDEKSFTAIGNDNYLYQLRYYLIQGIAQPNTSAFDVTNAYGSKYKIVRDRNTVVITKLGHYTKNNANAEVNQNSDTKGVANAWDESSFEKADKQVSKRFVWRMTKGYMQKAKAGGEVKFTDGYKGQNNLDGGVYTALKVEDGETYTDSISWLHLIVEADLAKNMGITYQNQSDLYSFDSTDSEVLAKLVDTYNALQGSLDCYEISDLVFNEGVFASDAFYYGCIPSSWLQYIDVFYVICAVIAFSVVALSLTLTLGKNTISSASAGARFTLMQEIKDLFVCCVAIVVGFGLINIIFYVSDLVVRIFASIATSTGRTIEGLQPSHLYGNLASLLLNYGYFGLKVYINITYIVRRFVLMALISTAPIFIIMSGFGQKGKDITKRWVSELVGHILIQPLHAVTFCIIITVATGLRSIESIALFACVLPLGNLFRSMITKGGTFATTQGQKIGGSLISQSSSVKGAEVLAETTEGARNAGAIAGGVIGTTGGVIAGGVTGGIPGAIAGGVAGGAGGVKKGAELAGRVGQARGQEQQTAFQTAGSMANMIASGGDDSGVSSGISGMGSARVNTMIAERRAASEIASMTAKAVSAGTGAMRGMGGTGPGGPSGGQKAAFATASGINSALGINSGDYNTGLKAGTAMGTQQRLEQELAKNPAFTARSNNVSTRITRDNAGNITGGSVSINRPTEGATAEQRANYQALYNSIKDFGMLKAGNYAPDSPQAIQGANAYNAQMSAMGLSPMKTSIPTLASNGTIHVQLDSAQMSNLVKGIGEAVNRN